MPVLNRCNVEVTNVSTATYHIAEIDYNLPAGESVNINDPAVHGYLFDSDALRALGMPATTLYQGLHSSPPKLAVKRIAAINVDLNVE